MNNVKVSVRVFAGTYRDVADSARTTINMDKGTKEVTDEYMHRMYKAEHSCIRLRQFEIIIENIPYWTAMHLVRHNQGVEKFVSTQRTDRTGENRNDKTQDSPVRLQMNCNAQAMINISRKRLCMCASKETRMIWLMVLDELKKIDRPLYECCVKECCYRGHCPEYKGCGYDKTEAFKEELNKYKGEK